MSAFLRRLTILEYLRSARMPKSTEEILRHLVQAGYLEEMRSDSANRRLIQRDMNFLYGKSDSDYIPGLDDPQEEPDDALEAGGSNEFGLQPVRGTGNSWLWQLDPYNSLQFDFEKMPPYMAIAFSMTRKHLSNLLPRNTLSELERFFEQAESRLEQSEQSLSPQLYRRLKDSVELYQRGQSLQPASFEAENLDTIYRAILLNRQISFRYRNKEYQVHPYGVAILLPKLYLVAKKDEDADADPEEGYRHFLIHKISQAILLERPASIPPDFSLASYLQTGHMDLLIDPEDNHLYDLRLRLSPTSVNSHLIEDLHDYPLSNQQQLSADADGSWLLQAKVRRTIQLRTWLLGLGAEARVEQPAIVRDDLTTYLSSVLNHYEAQDDGHR